MKKIIIILLILGVAIYFKVTTAEKVLSATGKVIDGTVNVVGKVVETVSNEVEKAAK